MKSNVHTMSDLFQQLGLPSDPQSIAEFISHHAGICHLYRLDQAPIWTESQRAFLAEAITQDADWCIPAEQLTSLLQHCPDQPTPASPCAP